MLSPVECSRNGRDKSHVADYSQTSKTRSDSETQKVDTEAFAHNHGVKSDIETSSARQEYVSTSQAQSFGNIVIEGC